MKKLIFTILTGIMLLAVLPLVSADVNVNYRMYEGSVSGSGVFSGTDVSVNDFQVIGFICADDSCSTTSGTLWGGQTLSSSGNTITLTYPTTLQSQYGYGIYYFKDGYIPWEAHTTWAGTGTVPGTTNNFLSRKQQCHAPIEALSVVNEAQPNIPLVINVNADIDATTYSAIANAGPLDYIPPALAEHYRVDTRVTLQVFNTQSQLVYEDTTDVEVEYSGSIDVDFIWTPTIAGDYMIKAVTSVTDGKCAASTSYTEEADKVTTVLSSSPTSMCYSILNDLETSDQTPTIGQQITITATRITNEADGAGALTPVGTNAVLVVQRQGEALPELTDVEVLAANPDDTNPVSFNFLWTPAKTGWYTITLSGQASACSFATSNYDTVAETIYVAQSINQAPVLDFIADIVVDEGDLVNIDPTATDPESDPLVYVYGYPLDTNGEWQTDFDDAGIYVVRVTVFDGDLTDFQDVRINVNDVNRAPIITSTAPTVAVVGNLYSYDVDATDADLDTLTYSLTQNPAGMTIDSNTGLIQWTPTAVGNYDVEVEVSDGTDIDTQPYTIAVQAAGGGNNDPVFTSAPVTTATIGVVYTYDADATDPDPDTLTYLLTQNPIGMTIDASTGVVTWTPSAVGNYDVTIEVDDGNGGTATQPYTISVSAPGNLPPEITSTPDTDAELDEDYEYDVDATDPNDDTLTYSLLSAPSDMTINSLTGLIEWTPDEEGEYYVEVQVSDGSLVDTQSFIIDVDDDDDDGGIIRISSRPKAKISDGEISTGTIRLTSSQVVDKIRILKMVSCLLGIGILLLLIAIFLIKKLYR